MAIIWARVYTFLGILLFIILLIVRLLHLKEQRNDELRRYCLEKEESIRTYERVDSVRALSIGRALEKKYPANKFATCTAYLWYADVYKYWDNNSRSSLYANKAMLLAHQEGFFREEAIASLQLEELSQHSEKALSLLHRATIVQKKCERQDPYLHFRLNYDYAYYYYTMTNYTLSKKYFMKALGYCKEYKMSFEKSMCLNGLTVVLTAQNKYEQALNIINYAIKVGEKFRPIECGDHYYQKGVLLNELGRIREAEIVVRKADSIYNKHPHPFNPGVVDIILSNIYRHKKDFKRDRIYSLSFLRKSKFLTTKMWAYNNLYAHHIAINDYVNALSYKDQLVKLKDSVYSDEIVQMAADKKTQLELYQQALQFEYQKKQYRLLLLLVCGLLVGTILFVFQIRRTGQLVAQLKEAEQQKLHQEVDFKERQLAASALHLCQHASTMHTIKSEIEKLSTSVPAEMKGDIKGILRNISSDISVEGDWDKFKLHFEGVSPRFFEKLREKAPNLTDLDLKQCAYLKMNMTPKQVAQLLAITPKSVTLSRVRIKKKLQLDEQMQLSAFLAAL